MEKKIGGVTLRSSSANAEPVSEKLNICLTTSRKSDRISNFVAIAASITLFFGAIAIFVSLTGDMAAREGGEFVGWLLLIWPLVFPQVIFPFCLPPAFLSVATIVENNVATVLSSIAAAVSQVFAIGMFATLNEGECPRGEDWCIALNDFVSTAYILSWLLAFGTMMFLGTRAEKLRKVQRASKQEVNCA